MKNSSSVWFNLTSILCYIVGVLYCFTLIGIPIGIYCFIAARKNNEYADLTDAQLVPLKKEIGNWAIFVSIVMCPIGLISIIPYITIGDNGIHVSTVDETKEQDKEQKTEPAPAKEEPKVSSQESVEMDNGEIDEKIKKLTDFKNDGIIGEEEYKKAVDELNSRRK